MAITLTCYKGEETSYSCCGGGTGYESFKGLLVDDDGTQTKIYWPFEVFFDNTAKAAAVSDYKGTVKTIPLSEAGDFSSFTDLKGFIENCAFDKPFYQFFENVSSSEVTVTIADLPSSNIHQRVQAFRDGGKMRYIKHFTIDAVNNKLLFSRTLEGEDIELYII